ncbi:MAG TPA: hypothetical protein VIP77_21940 [Jiangellaceae bacterium]
MANSRRSTYTPEFPRHHDAALATGHSGSDYFVVLEFAEAVRTCTAPFFDVYRAVTMAEIGIQAWRSCLADGAPFPIHDLDDPRARAVMAADAFSPDPSAAGARAPVRVGPARPPSADAVAYTEAIWNAAT